MPLLPKNLHNLRDLREKNSPFRGDKQKFLVSFNFPIVALDGKFPFPWRSFFLFTPFGTGIIFVLPPHARIRSLLWGLAIAGTPSRNFSAFGTAKFAE